MTRALVNEVYLLNALVKTSSETSLLKSPTNNRNHAENALSVTNRLPDQRTHKGSIPTAFDPPRPFHPLSVEPSFACPLWPACLRLPRACRSWPQGHIHFAVQECQHRTRKRWQGRGRDAPMMNRRRGRKASTLCGRGSESDFSEG